MNKELNLVEILKDCPKGMKLWSPCWGELTYKGIDWNEYKAWDYESDDVYPILTTWVEEEFSFNPYGKYVDNGDVMIYPSKDNRDWSTFQIPKPKWNPDTLQPFDKVLVRHDPEYEWKGNFFTFKDKSSQDQIYSCTFSKWRYCIPYNDETKHLLGTSDEAPEYYRL